MARLLAIVMIAVLCGHACGLGNATRAMSQRLRRVAQLPGEPDDIGVVREDFWWMRAGRTLWTSRDQGEHWHPHALPLEQDSERTTPFVHSMGFASPLVAWVLTREELLLSRDGGNTWEHRALPEVGDGNLLSAWFDEQGTTGWVGGSDCVAPSLPIHQYPRMALCSIEEGGQSAKRAIVYRTSDGGESWSVSEHWPDTFDVQYLKFHSETEGVAVTASSIFCTHDGGRHWSMSRFPAECTSGPLFGVNKAVFFLDGRFGWISNDEGFLLRTRDGGTTWCEVRPRKPGEYSMQLLFLDERTGFRAEAGLWETKDGGVSWSGISTDRPVGALVEIGRGRWAVSMGSILYEILPGK